MRGALAVLALALALALQGPGAEAFVRLPFVQSNSGATKPVRPQRSGAVRGLSKGWCRGSPGEFRAYKIVKKREVTEPRAEAGRPGGAASSREDLEKLQSMFAEEFQGPAIGPQAGRGLQAGRARPALTNPQGPLASYCRKERRIKPKPRKQLSRGERLLLQCLNANRCVLGAEEDAEELKVRTRGCDGRGGGLTRENLKATVRALPGMRMLRRKPRCLFQNKKSCPRSSGNRETGAEVDTAAQAAKNRAVAKGRIYRLQTRRDIAFNAYDSCAVVGNGPGLARDQVGGLIDQYDVVLRMNHVNYRAPERRYASATGKKTTHRVFSKMASYLLAEGKIRIPGRAGEKWLFWHDRSRHAIAALSNKSGFQADLLMFSPVSSALSSQEHAAGGADTPLSHPGPHQQAARGLLPAAGGPPAARRGAVQLSVQHELGHARRHGGPVHVQACRDFRAVDQREACAGRGALRQQGAHHVGEARVGRRHKDHQALPPAGKRERLHPLKRLNGFIYFLEGLQATADVRAPPLPPSSFTAPPLPRPGATGCVGRTASSP